MYDHNVTFNDDGTPYDVHFPIDLRIPWAEFERFYRPHFERARAAELVASEAETDAQNDDTE